MNISMARVPYMPQEMIDWLGSHLTKDMRVFEWGSGGSTLFIAPRVKSIITIESSKRWYIKVLLSVIFNLVFNCRLKLILPEPASRQSKQTEPYRSSGKYGHLTYKKYVEAIDSYPDVYFDLIIVDGRCRTQCLLHARTKVKRGGSILLDDADRPHYVDSINALTDFTKHPINRGLILKRL